MGLLSTLLEWNRLDPPSRVEQLRNDRICKLYQHNRNPFIDHPEYGNLIWKHASSDSPVVQHPNMEAAINEFHYGNNVRDQHEVRIFSYILYYFSTAYEVVFYSKSSFSACFTT